MATYLSSSATAPDRAQAELYEHLSADSGGRCTTCREYEPCRRRAELYRILLYYGRLPRRQPGRSRAGLRRV